MLLQVGGFPWTSTSSLSFFFFTLKARGKKTVVRGESSLGRNLFQKLCGNGMFLEKFSSLLVLFCKIRCFAIFCQFLPAAVSYSAFFRTFFIFHIYTN